MPLTLQQSGVEIPIKKVGGKDETRKRLEKLGFVTGSTVTVVSELNGSLIVRVKDSRVAISREMASKILV
jgi:ferrous iron transport protein A